jgi:hypothetical protein
MDLMPIGDQPPRQIGNIGLASTASREHTFVAESDVHVSSRLLRRSKRATPKAAFFKGHFFPTFPCCCASNNSGRA